MYDELSKILHQVSAEARSRFDLWVTFVNQTKITSFAEIGVWRGAFAEHIIRNCPLIEHYYMIDPWRHLDNWNKPANVSDRQFDLIFEEAMERTDFAADKRVVLRARTTEAMPRLANAALDAAYIDGDHTLKGITIDLISVYDKLKPGGFVLGDDFTRSIWQHHRDFEPTLVFPLAVYFAEAKGDTIYGLPFSQFLIVKSKEPDAFRFHDFTQSYQEASLRKQVLGGPRGRARRLFDRLRARITRSAD